MAKAEFKIEKCDICYACSHTTKEHEAKIKACLKDMLTWGKELLDEFLKYSEHNSPQEFEELYNDFWNWRSGN